MLVYKVRQHVLDPLTMGAFRSSPALLTHFATGRITVEMAEKVIACTAELVAEWPVVISIASEPQTVFKSERVPVMVE